jgi:hypothetical protein
MATCPEGHESAAADYCDVCGIRIGPPAAPSTGSGAETSGPPDAGAAPSGLGALCPRCGAAGLVRYCEACGYQVGSDPAAAQTPVSGATPAPAAPPVAAGTSESAAVLGSALFPDPGDIAEPSSSASATAPDAPGSGGPPAHVPAGWTAVVSASRSYFDAVIAERGPDAASVQYPAYCPERRYQLVAPQMRIGRRSVSRGISPEIDLTGPPTDPGISRLHAILLAKLDGSWMITDPGSENGTKVNDTEIEANVPVPLADGDHVFLGAWTAMAILRDSDPADPIAPKPDIREDP